MPTRTISSESKAEQHIRKKSRYLSLPHIGGVCTARRSLSRAGAVASSVASNVSALACSAVSNASSAVSSVSASVSASVVTASHELTSFANFARTEAVRRPNLKVCLPALEDRPHTKLPRLSLEGSEASRPTMALHNVGLIRWIFEEARSRHVARPSYQARQHDLTREKYMHCVILREVCADIRSATRGCCKAYRALKILNQAALDKKESKDRIACNLRLVRRKLLVAGLLCKMLCKVREDNERAELMWKTCCDGLGSFSVSSAAFGCRSLGLQSFRPSFACGSITLGLRKCKKKAMYTEFDDSENASV